MLQFCTLGFVLSPGRRTDRGGVGPRQLGGLDATEQGRDANARAVSYAMKAGGREREREKGEGTKDATTNARSLVPRAPMRMGTDRSPEG